MCRGLLHDFTPQISMPCFFHHVFNSSALRSFNTESSQLNLGLTFFLLTSGWEQDIFMQSTLSSILATFPNLFNLPILITFTMLGSVYKLYSSSLYLILHIALTQISPQIFFKIVLSNILNSPSSVLVTATLNSYGLHM